MLGTCMVHVFLADLPRSWLHSLVAAAWSTPVHSGLAGSLAHSSTPRAPEITAHHAGDLAGPVPCTTIFLDSRY